MDGCTRLHPQKASVAVGVSLLFSSWSAFFGVTRCVSMPPDSHPAVERRDTDGALARAVCFLNSGIGVGQTRLGALCLYSLLPVVLNTFTGIRA